MAWLQRIPPMISALAFGYGVGMSAPDSAFEDVRTAVDAYRGNAVPQAAPHAWAGYGPSQAYGYPPPGYGPPTGYGPAGYGPPPGYGAPPGYGPPGQGAYGTSAPTTGRRGAPESPQLAALRAEEGGAQSCKTDEPSFSAAPPLVSGVEEDDAFDDVDDLDEAGREALSRLQLPNFKVRITQRAIRYVRFLTRSDRGRGMFETWLKRSGQYQDLVLEHLRERSLPEDLIWVAMIESGFDARAVSPAGAAGLWQFMPRTGAVYGLDVDRWVDMRKDPQEASRAAAHHLRDLYQRFGDWELALASYNMGYEQLLTAIDRYNTTDFWELARQRAIPRETSNYVPKIIAAALVSNNLERYGFSEVKLFEPVSSADLTVPGGSQLKIIAKAAGITLGKLQSLNPHLRAARVPPDRRDFVVHIPAETLSRARAALPALLDRRVALSDADILDPLDLLEGRGRPAKKTSYHAWNEDENLLSQLPKPNRSMRDILGERGAADEAVDALARDLDDPRRSGRETVMYRVGVGDTLIGVAKQFAIDVDDLARDNGLEADSQLQEGSLLKLLVKRNVLSRWKKSGAADIDEPSADLPRPAPRRKKSDADEAPRGKKSA